MKSHFKISIILFSAAIFLCGCGSGLNTVSIDSDKTVKLKNYSIHSPIGDDWEYQPNEVTQSVMFYLLDTDLMYYVSGGKRSGTSINIYRDQTRMDTKNIDRQEFVSGYVDNDFQIIEQLSGMTFVYKPEIAKRDTILINEKIFYKMNYGSDEESWGQLYIYLPKSFEENGIFYVFRIEEDGGEEILSSGNDFDQIKNVLATFKCDED
jgi:hypothetical protein